MRNALIVAGTMILGIVFGSMVYSYRSQSANTSWQPIDYFPFPVTKILGIRPMGKEFWVESDQHLIYKITYPCLKSVSCWQRVDHVPSDLAGKEYVLYNVQSGGCKNDRIVLPLPWKIDTCTTSTTLGGESAWVVSVALVHNKLWIWNQPWTSPYDGMSASLVAPVTGAVLGIFVGIAIVERYGHSTAEAPA